MFALRAEFLTGRCVAKETHQSAEWPPHPARLFSALVSALYAPVDPALPPPPEYEAEREALEWLQKLGAPEIAFAGDALRRAVVKAYVPVNDLGLPRESPEKLQNAHTDALAGKVKMKPGRKSDPITAARKRLREAGEQALALLPERTGARKDRTFPTVTPNDAVVHFIWARADAGKYREAIERILSRVSYLGHSSSLIAISIVDTGLPERRWVPGGRGMKLRGFTNDQLRALDQVFASNERMAQSYRLPFEPVSYGVPALKMIEPASVFSRDWVVFRKVRGADLSLTATLDLTHALCRAALDRAQERGASQRAIALLSGKDASGSPLREDHLAWLALPFVGWRGARGLGDCKGVAAVLPAFLDRPENAELADEILGALDLGLSLPIGDLGAWEVERAASAENGATLNPLTWTRASSLWATVTPLVLDRHPGHLFGRAARTEAQVAAKEKSAREAEDCVTAACRRISLSEPEEVRLSRFSSIVGVPPTHHFRPPPKRAGSPQRWHVHATLRFADAVTGPVLLGAGRYLGYGLCRPLDKANP